MKTGPLELLPPDEVRRVDLGRLRAYLTTTGWLHKPTTKNPLVAIFERPEDRLAQVRLPTAPDLADYDFVLARSLALVARWEGRPVQGLSQDLLVNVGDVPDNGRARRGHEPMPLAVNDIESELSYAYLHAVAARAGCECVVTGRHSDGMGVDARLHVDEDFGPDAPLCRFSVEIQLKATAQEPAQTKNRWSYRLRREHYDKLRRTDLESPLLLIVLQLPAEREEWLRCTPRALTLKRCAYWVSLHGAPESANESYQTVYLPRANAFMVDPLRELLARFARRERIPYVA